MLNLKQAVAGTHGLPNGDSQVAHPSCMRRAQDDLRFHGNEGKQDLAGADSLAFLNEDAGHGGRHRWRERVIPGLRRRVGRWKPPDIHGFPARARPTPIDPDLPRTRWTHDLNPAVRQAMAAELGRGFAVT